MLSKEYCLLAAAPRDIFCPGLCMYLLMIRVLVGERARYYCAQTMPC